MPRNRTCNGVIYLIVYETQVDLMSTNLFISLIPDCGSTQVKATQLNHPSPYPPKGGTGRVCACARTYVREGTTRRIEVGRFDPYVPAPARFAGGLMNSPIPYVGGYTLEGTRARCC